MYTLGVSADRRYHLQSEEANRAVDALLEQLRVPEGQWRLYSDMLTTVLKLYEDGAGVVDLKITSAALKELRYGYKVFAPWRNVPKVTVFGSAAHARRPSGIPAGPRIRQADDLVGLDGDDRRRERRDGLGPGGGRPGKVLRAQYPAAVRAGGQSLDPG
jgi:hypothetical protein